MGEVLSFDPGPGKMWRLVTQLEWMKSGNTTYLQYCNEGKNLYYERVDEHKYEEGTVAYLFDKITEKRWLAIFKNGEWMDSDFTTLAESLMTSPDNLTVVEVLGNVNV